MQGKKVLLVDADPQGDLTTALGWPDNEALPVMLSTIMDNIIHDREFEYYSDIIIFYNRIFVGIRLLIKTPN